MDVHHYVVGDRVQLLSGAVLAPPAGSQGTILHCYEGSTRLYLVRFDYFARPTVIDQADLEPMKRAEAGQKALSNKKQATRPSYT